MVIIKTNHTSFMANGPVKEVKVDESTQHKLVNRGIPER